MRWRGLLLTCLLCLPLLPLADDARVQFELHIGSLQREGIAAQGIELLIDSGTGDLKVQGHIAELSLPQLDAPLRGIRFDCPASRAPWPQLQCEGASASLADSPWGPQQLQLDLHWQNSEHWSLGFSGLSVGGDSLQGRAQLSEGQWQVEAKSARLRLEQVSELQAIAREHGLQQLDGRLAASLQAQGNAEGLHRLSLNGRLSRLGYADRAGQQAAEQLSADFSLAGRVVGRRWLGALKLDVLGGEAYSEPVYLDFKAQPVKLLLDGSWQAERQHLAFRQLRIDAGDMLQLNGNGSLDVAQQGMLAGELHVQADDLGRTYTSLLQPWLIGTRLDDLQLAGSGGMRLAWQGGSLSALDGAVTGLDFAHKDGSFGANGLRADLHWRASGEVPESTLGMQGAYLGPLMLGAARARLYAAGQSLHLLQPLQLPFFDGEIALEEFAWVQSDAGPDAGFSLALREVSLEQLTGAFGWPPMRGTVNGQIPRARYYRDRLSVAGDIRVQAFDGQLLLRGLALDQLSSAAPVLSAELELQRLDLAKVTETFSFGRIQGRLDGEVRNLQLVAWQPNRFDALFRSSPDDDLPHRISQRAVENLTELGNGVPGALSGSFLSIFKEFSYDRVELRISQRGAQATIDGIPHADGGFYLVKGRGIPRIDVIGRNRQVSWKDLLARLKAIRLDRVQLQ